MLSLTRSYVNELTIEVQEFFFDQQLPRASWWTYLTKRGKSEMLYHYTDIQVKDHLTDLVAAILDKIFRTPTTKRLKINIF